MQENEKSETKDINLLTVIDENGICNCIGIIDQRLEEIQPDSRLVTGFTLTGKEVLYFETYFPLKKGNKKGMHVFCTYCPFCGHKIGEKPK